MITRVQISDEASFGPDVQTLDDLKATNFIYGANGSGKTTISRLIADHGSRGGVTWPSAMPLECHVYNSDWVSANLHQSEAFKGIFCKTHHDAHYRMMMDGEVLPKAQDGCVEEVLAP